MLNAAYVGAAGGDRTHDPWLRRPILYPLSYSRKTGVAVVCKTKNNVAHESYILAAQALMLSIS